MSRWLPPREVRPGDVAILGVPYDGKSSFRRGAAAAPAAIREALASPSTNRCTESGRDLDKEPRLRDLGDLDPSSCAALEEIESAFSLLAATGARVIALGGDHSISYPILRGFAGSSGIEPTVCVLDAHPDLYDEFEGDRFSHACPFARIMEAGLARRLVQVGIRGANPEQRRQAERFGVETFDMRAWGAGERPELDGPLYLSLDLDGLDPAFAPGVSHPEPGGLDTRGVLDWIQSLRGPVVGADIVELNPDLDPTEISARVAAKLLKEVADRILASSASWENLRANASGSG